MLVTSCTTPTLKLRRATTAAKAYIYWPRNFAKVYDMPSHSRSASRRGARSESNARCEIDNPLAHLSPDRLERSAREFAERINSNEPDYQFWSKATQVARFQHVPFYDRIKGLTALEKRTIREQKNLGFWQQPRPLRVTIATLCLAAVIQGWVQTGLNGANLTWAKELGLTDHDGVPTENREIWIFAAINAVLYLSASILGCWLSDPLQSLILGRRGAIFFSACLCLAGATGCGFSRTWPQLLGCRLVLGAAMGAKASVTPIYGAEVSPPHLRGALVMNWQLFDTFGIFLGFTANLIVSQTGDNRWRYEVASAVIPTLVLLSLVWTIPESPRWLLKKGRYQEAFASFCELRETPLQAAAELYYANAQIQAELKLIGRTARCRDVEVVQNGNSQSSDHTLVNTKREIGLGYIRHNENIAHGVERRTPALRAPVQPPRPSSESERDDASHNTAVKFCLPLKNCLKRCWDAMVYREDDMDLEEYQRRAKASFYVTRVWQLFSVPRIRRATTAALVVMITQQMCGINILQFYSTTIFHDPKSETNSLVGPGLSLGFGLANFIFTFPVYRFIDKRGRRFLLLSSYPGMIFSMLGACFSYYISNETRRLVVVVMFMFFFVFFYSWGQGPVPFAYSSEVFPLLNREAGMSFAVFANLFGAGILALIVPQLTRALASFPDQSDDHKKGELRLLGIFTVLNVLALIMIFFLVPETAGATLGSQDSHVNYISLEELNYIFNVKTREHIRYQVRVMVPWAWDVVKWKVTGKGEKPEDPYPLYTWVQVEQVNELGREVSEAHAE
ncbi:hypothetical protein HBI25_115120 [Parastagonospora nodorum]|nr:hypothetical protein HBH54_067110 [Parastagonospora nodorum]KAH4039957.1 hypothetical protein HBI09_039120 [Parastagonospora nodorum]KAH4047381.1 hypothetical protein HBH49_173410 [Parastagonospora nodorum]KAH4075969.1 hypothetical protein HBH50_024110 [Parastagonospora nodorum]KAH4108628.1 hypothetical protein HBH46_047110 [Parastagonospora nodorum]